MLSSDSSITRAVALPREIAVDLGTATTQVFVRGKGIVLSEPTVVAVDRRTEEVVEVGRAALRFEREPSRSVEVVWPVRSGAVDKTAVVRRYLSKLLRPYVGGLVERTRVIVCVPSTTTPMERRALREATKRAGASQVHLIEQTIAAALGGDLPVHEPVGSMIVVAGAGITEAALLSLGCVVGSANVRAGSGDVDGDIKQAIRRDYGMVVSTRTAEDIKLALAQLSSRSDQLMIEARGQMVLDGTTATALLERDEVQPAVDAYVQRTLQAVHECLVQAPPELSQDLFERGVHLAGGSAPLCGLAEAIANEFELPVHVLGNPERVAVLGAGKCLEAIESLKSLFVGEN
jgi:rod shape-determining protein MreB and related proteins